MAKEYKCGQCEKKFQNGEIVGISQSGKYYHHIVRQLNSQPMDCVFKSSMKNGIAIIEQKKVYFENNFYSIEKVAKLSKKENLNIRLNDDDSGDFIDGNLNKLKRGNLIKKVIS